MLVLSSGCQRRRVAIIWNIIGMLGLPVSSIATTGPTSAMEGSQPSYEELRQLTERQAQQLREQQRQPEQVAEEEHLARRDGGDARRLRRPRRGVLERRGRREEEFLPAVERCNMNDDDAPSSSAFLGARAARRLPAAKKPQRSFL